LLVAALCAATAGAVEPASHPPTLADVLAATKPTDWHPLDPDETLYLEFARGRVVIELAPVFAPRHVANIKALVRARYFDGLEFLRVQDNYVVQWGDPNADARTGDAAVPRAIPTAVRKLKAEFTVPLSSARPFVALPDRDGYAAQTGFVGDFPAARDPRLGSAWLTHCYGTVGVGRDDDIDSGSGTELYVVIGASPRWLDRNVTVVGRVVEGMEWLASLPRGHGPQGFYERNEQRLPIDRVRLASEVPPEQRSRLEILRTDTPAFAAVIEARRNRRETWYKVPAGYIDVCSVPIPVRPIRTPPAE
jgi:peptidylprolyl isomerase